MTTDRRVVQLRLDRDDMDTIIDALTNDHRCADSALVTHLRKQWVEGARLPDNAQVLEDLP